MKKLIKSRSGFTLVEMVLVIAIIVILSAVTIIFVSEYLNHAKLGRDKISIHYFEIISESIEIEAKT